MLAKAKRKWTPIITLQPKNTQSMTDAHIKGQNIFPMYF